MELCEPHSLENKDKPRFISQEQARQEAADEEQKAENCRLHGLCDGEIDWWPHQEVPS